jgi:succinylarginine dihydrolase
MKTHEVNFDGLVGPTHNYAGLSHGNVASMSHRGAVSNPRAAALQGLAKMRLLHDLGVPQAVLPPHERPAVDALRAFGFSGDDRTVLATAARQAPRLLVASSSASAMWVANAATVTPSRDTADGRVHFTPANLVSKLHRAIEPPQTARTLRAIFRDPQRFVVHEPVCGAAGLGDEGAANHTRLAASHGTAGLHLFVYGHEAFSGSRRTGPRRFASRQAREVGEMIARRHGLADTAVVHAQQLPAAIDAGVFHNDVIAVGNENLLLYHERAFAAAPRVVAELRARWAGLKTPAPLHLLKVPAKRVTLRDAVKSYLFNSQLVTLPNGEMALIAPADCAANRRVREFVQETISAGATPLRAAHFLDLRESMRNGGGPACLRLRVVLTDAELAAMAPGVRFSAALHAQLETWVKLHYRDRLTPRDLADPALLEESRRALDELTSILGLGAIYPFQR